MKTCFFYLAQCDQVVPAQSASETHGFRLASVLLQRRRPRDGRANKVQLRLQSYQGDLQQQWRLLRTRFSSVGLEFVTRAVLQQVRQWNASLRTHLPGCVHVTVRLDECLRHLDARQSCFLTCVRVHAMNAWLHCGTPRSSSGAILFPTAECVVLTVRGRQGCSRILQKVS